MNANPVPTAKKKVLIVDDELNIRIYVSVLFETRGYTPIATKNGKEGLQKAKELSPDLIILDVMMPEAGGVTMYRELKIDPQLKHIPVIMLTGVGEKSFTHYLKMLKIQVKEPLAEPEGYMEKPLDQERLLDLAETLLT